MMATGSHRHRDLSLMLTRNRGGEGTFTHLVDDRREHRFAQRARGVVVDLPAVIPFIRVIERHPREAEVVAIPLLVKRQSLRGERPLLRSEMERRAVHERAITVEDKGGKAETRNVEPGHNST